MRTPMTCRSALLWMTHIWNEDIKEEFEKLTRMEWAACPDVWLVAGSIIPVVTDLCRVYERCFIIDDSTILSRLPYPSIDTQRIIYNAHFPLLDFFLSHPEYDFFWFIEFDVRYTGDWESLFRAFEKDDSDFITSHIRRLRDEPYWCWWDSLSHPSKAIPRDQYVRSYNVIFRISKRALWYIHEAQKDGWRGHNEVSLPTLLLQGGFSITDFGGNGEFVPAGRVNAVYTSHGLKNGMLCPFCTMRWRPSSPRPGILKNKIYHSIKPRQVIEPFGERYRYVKEWFTHFFRYYVLKRTL